MEPVAARGRITGMRRLVRAGLATALLALPASASAGAPNYDCLVAGGGRLSIDQWAGVVAASGFDRRHAVWGTTTDIHQAGPSLDLTVALAGVPWTVAVRGMGSSVAIIEPGQALAGRCAFVPGDFVLRRSDAGGFAVRSRPSAHARRMLRVAVGSPVWEDPHRRQHGRWLAVRTFASRDGAIRALAGWLRQTKPLVPRYPGTGSS